MHLDQIAKVIIENREIFAAFLLSLIAIIRLTTWGKAQAAALDAVVGVIESVGAVDVKTGVAGTQKQLSGGAKDAIADSVAKADPNKTQKSLVVRVLRELFRVT